MKKYLYRAVLLILLVSGGICIYKALDHLLSADTQSQTRVTFHDFYSLDSLDILFVGPSHTTKLINAVKLTEDLGKSVFNMSNSNQDPAEAYFIIKEALERYDPEHIFMEISPSRFMVEEPEELSIAIVTDYMEDQAKRFRLITDSLSSDHYVSTFLRVRRYVDPLELPPGWKLGWNHRQKSTKQYREYLGTEEYLGRGQWCEEGAISQEGKAAVNLNSRFFDDFTVDDISERQWSYYIKILELCRKEGVDLTLYVTPCTQMYLMKNPDFFDVTDHIAAEAAARGFDKIDLNLVKKEIFDYTLDDFYVIEHMRAERSGDVADFLEMYMADPEGDYFYDSIYDRYPVTDEVIAAGFTVSLEGVDANAAAGEEEGEAEDNDAPGAFEGAKMHVAVSAFAYEDTPVSVRLWRTQYNEVSGEWENVEEYAPEAADELSSSFTLPYDEYATNYRVQLLDPQTGGVLYETLTFFDMK